MTHLNVFRNFGSVDGRLGFYTKETRKAVPELPGCYAWFLPLWFYRQNLDELMHIVGKLVAYDHVSEREVDVPFTWDSVNLRVRRDAAFHATDDVRATWNNICANEPTRQALQQILLEASLLMPPLYVGRTGNLKRRYLEHTAGSAFHSRFTDYVAKLGIKIGVSDLLFVCIETERELDKVLSDVAQSDLDRLIERILMQFCRPPFSLR